MPKKKTAETPPAEPAQKLTIALPPLVAPEPTFTADDVSDSPEATRSLLGAPARTVNKPDISRLPDGVVDGRPVFGPGDRVVLERYAAMLPGAPYVDTRTWYVNAVDLETGRVKLFDEALMQHGTANWKVGGAVFKLAMGTAVTTKRKRGRPRKAPVEGAAPAVTTPSTPGEKRKRGRPPGSKNRPKEVIVAERKVKKLAKAAKVAAKKAKRA